MEGEFKNLINNNPKLSDKNWKDILSQFNDNNSIKKINDILKDRNYTPNRGDIFKVFENTLFGNIELLILGQDPYPALGQADGLAFSWKDGFTFNSFKDVNEDKIKSRNKDNLDNLCDQDSLLYIYIALYRSISNEDEQGNKINKEEEYKGEEIGKYIKKLFHIDNEKDSNSLNRYISDKNGKKEDIIKIINEWRKNLEDWTIDNQGNKKNILLLNSALTIGKDGKSHIDIWKPFTTFVIRKIIEDRINNKKKLAIMLWGNPAVSLFKQSIKGIQNFKIKNLDKKKMGLYNGFINKNWIEYANEKKIELPNYEPIEIFYKTNTIISNGNIKVFYTTHPSGESHWRGFDIAAPYHFQEVAKFLLDNEN